VGGRFKLGGFSLGRCGSQVQVESDCWRDVGNKLKLEELLLERCEQQVQVGTAYGAKLTERRFLNWELRGKRSS
jgi:hypothetical protein